ncbi:MAG: hypothetical protein K5910_01535 [Bacteroidales bacterium]|nr:hypothetical protein [Bacteroidales bacterium]
MYKRWIISLLGVFLGLSASAQYLPVAPNPYGERPVIVPVPESVAGVSDPVISLDEGWFRKESPAEDFHTATSLPAGFEPFTLVKPVWDTRTPNAVVGFFRTVRIPADFAGKRVILRFDGTTHAAKLWVNGKYVRDHWGSYTSWTADVTDCVTPGQEARIALRLDERPEGLAAFVRFSADIHGHVKLYAVPDGHFERLRLHTDLDAAYRDATLRLWLSFPQGTAGSVRVTLTDPKGKKVSTAPASFKLPAGMDEFQYDLKVKNPLKWDAEHPHLYQLTLSLLDARGRVVETVCKNVGFRKLERRGNQLFVNGQEVKFRGIWGVDDAKTMRDLNANHVRHKYMTEEILDDCDRYGVYVLHENGVDFAKFRRGESPEYAWQWLALLQDMMERDYSHPCVVMWGLGNESYNGDFTLLTHRYAKFDDPDRQTMFSWANRISPDEEIPYDIYSYHYAPFNKPDLDLSRYGVSVWHSPSLLLDRADAPAMPVLVDESTHVTISSVEAGRDPNVRNFWGESIKRSWEVCWNTPGALGLDQFGMFTDIPGWDMPEQWLMRKAYSPFVIAERDYALPGPGQGLAVEVENRFSHTDLSEVSIEWKTPRESGVVKGPKTAPRGKGTFVIPAKVWQAGDVVELAVKRADGVQVDEYRLNVGAEPFRLPGLSAAPPKVEQTRDVILVSGKDFTLTFDKWGGQIQSLVYKGETVLTGGPHLQVLGSNLAIGEFWPQSVSVRTEGSEAVIDLDVLYSPIAGGFQIRIDGNGLMTVHYTVKHLPDPAPRVTTIPWGSCHYGGYTEVGVVFTMPGEVDRIQWDRRGLWTTYPDTHIGREQGVAYRTVEKPRERNWSELSYDFNWMGGNLARSNVSNDFRASKEYIRTAEVLLAGKTVGIQALSEEQDAVRLETPRFGAGGISLYINNLWNYPTLGVGNYMKPAIIIGDGYSNTVHLRPVDIAE